jgi:hypothetical protein
MSIESNAALLDLTRQARQVRFRRAEQAAGQEDLSRETVTQDPEDFVASGVEKDRAVVAQCAGGVDERE